MKRYVLFMGMLLLSAFTNAQVLFQPTEEYMKLASAANHLYQERKFKEAGLMYDSAFALTHGLGARWHLHNAVRSWALANNPGRAFFYLNELIRLYQWSDLEDVKSDTSLLSLHSNPLWQPTLDLVRKNKEIKDAKLNNAWVSMLATVLKDDQEGRLKMEETLRKYGWQSIQMRNLNGSMEIKDSINLIKVKSILVNGWPGFDEVGEDGADALFLVIQHADSLTHITYLPLLRDAVKMGKARPQNLALIEDRTLVLQGKPQIYGSQLKGDSTGWHQFYPIVDEPNVNKRRASAFLEPLEDYAKEFGFEYVVPKKE